MNSNIHTIIPDSENHCVWMDAGLVDYKLCSLAFECESCPFDAVMKEQHTTFAEQAARISEYNAAHRDSGSDLGASESKYIERIIAPLRSLMLPEDRIYFSNHTWMKSLHNGMFRTGIDEFLALMIYPVAGVATIHTPSHIGQGEPYAWLIRDSATFAVRNNEKGITASINEQLIEHPSLVTNDPYGEGWLMTLACSGKSSSNLKFYTADEFKDFLLQETDDLSHELNNIRHRVGITLCDGGIRVENIENLIGEKRYNKLLTRLMSPH